MFIEIIFPNNMPYKKKRRTNGGYVGKPARSSGGRKRKLPSNRRRGGSTARRRMSRQRRSNRAIKQVVEKVIACKDNVGVYTKFYTGDFQPTVALGTKSVQIAANRLQAEANPYNSFSMGFTPFSTKRVWDAASVLFKGKTKSVDITDLAANFTYTGLKVDVLYASYHLTLTNMTTTSFVMEFIEITNKSNSQSSFMDVTAELLKGTNWTGGVPTWNNAGKSRWGIDIDLDFGMIKGVDSRYALKSYGKKTVHPGQTINYFSKDKFCLDFQKKLVTESASADPEVPSFAKGEKQVVVVYHPVIGLSADPSTFSCSLSTVGTDITKGFVTTAKEVFKIIEPDKTPDANQGDKRTFLTDCAGPIGSLTRYEKTFGPSYSSRTSIV